MGGFGVGVTLHFMTSQYQPAINLNSSCKHTHVSSTVSMRRLKVGNSVYVAVAHCLSFIRASSNHTPGSRPYFDLVDTWADSVCIHQLVLKPCSKSASTMARSN